MKEITIILTDDSEARALFGKHDENIKAIEKAFGVRTVFRGGDLKVSSPEEKSLDKAEKVLKELLHVVRRGCHISVRDVDYAIKTVDRATPLHDILLDKIEVFSRRAHIAPRSEGQKRYLDAIKRSDIVFGIGPAGTGKTYLAMAMAVNALKKKIVSRIILTRPAVEAGESLGYLPGDLYEKVNPYLRPLYDALYDMVDVDTVQEYLEKGVIEVAPLAFMRGRTLNDSFIILDEAQNATPEQMKMFLTRLGFDSKTVITGDITQVDLPKGRKSGLIHVQKLLKGISGIEFVLLKGQDVVRHELVQKIIEVYRRSGAENEH
ncbi:MAG: AAA family ATPase [Candidatus Omnitrophica bacterium]|nr:AAA family ATPase [Candidatus Omnitrophota bacterium]